nr:unnamed protein product [Digitaria exilis]
MPSFSLALVLLLSFSSSCSEQEERSLLQFLAGLSQNGGLAASWRNGTDCCTWEGITCNANTEVTEISLASRGLEGHVSPSIGSLKGMLHLNLSGNSLSGGLPLEVMFSSTMVSLDVSFNRLSGDLLELPSSTPGRPLQDNLHSKHLILSTEESLIAVLQQLRCGDDDDDGDREEDDDEADTIELQPTGAYHRLLLHRLAEIYGFAHESVGEGEDRHLVLQRCPETAIPPVLVSDMLWKFDNSDDFTSVVLTRNDTESSNPPI